MVIQYDLSARWLAAVTVIGASILSQSGCMPGIKEEKVAKHRSSKEVTGRWTTVRASRGQTSNSTYTVDGKEFSALWEIMNPLNGKAKLQLKLPADWSTGEKYNAVAHVFETEPDQPWYYPIEDVFLSDLRRGLLSEEQKTIIPGGTDDMPYDTSVTVIKYDGETFIEMTARLIPGVE